MIDMNPIIIEIGNYSTRIGIAGESFPRINFPSVFGQPDPEMGDKEKKYLMEIYGLTELSDLVCGDAAIYYSKLLKKIPLVYDQDFYDLDLLEYFLEYISYIYDFNFKNKDFLIIQPFNSKILQTLSELLFAKYEMKSVIPVIQPFADLVASGLENGSGLIVNIGHLNCNLTPFFKGNIVSEGLLRGYLGGNDITNLLNNELRTIMEGLESSKIIDFYNLANDIKESLCFTSLSPKREFKKAMAGEITKNIPLFKGESINLHIPLYNTPEILFNPGLFNKNEYSIKELIKKSILNCTNTLRREISNIILTGGCSLLRGLRERLIRELLGELGDLEFDITNFQEINDPRFSSWIGASRIWASKQDLTPIRITVDEYTKSGGEIKINSDYYSKMTNISLGALKKELDLRPMNPFEIGLYNKYIYDILLNIIKEYQKIDVSELSEIVKVPELKIIKMLYTLIARNLINGDIDQASFEFINYGYGREQIQPKISIKSQQERRTTNLKSQNASKDSQISEGLRKKVLNAQEVDHTEIIIDDSVPTFAKIDEKSKDIWEKEESPVLTQEKIEKMRQKKLEKLKKFKELEKQKITAESTKPINQQKRVTQLPEELITGPSFKYLDKIQETANKDISKDEEIQKEPKAKDEARSYAQLIESRTKPETIKKVDPNLLTSQDLLLSNEHEDEDEDKEIETKKELTEKKTEIEEDIILDEGLLLGISDKNNKMKRKVSKKGRTEKQKPRDAKLLVPDVPTFQLLGNEPQKTIESSNKVNIDGLLQSKRNEQKSEKKIKKDSIPTFMQIDSVSKEQLDKIKQIDKDEEKKKKREPKLL
ncbi:MAG: hypothetical protein GF329_16945 [Candidatus Lokiarchaeota archaeon]|nr:hypothetical protein [Candidatus Lokiarchaeota archaeon]